MPLYIIYWRYFERCHWCRWWYSCISRLRLIDYAIALTLQPLFSHWQLMRQAITLLATRDIIIYFHWHCIHYYLLHYFSLNIVSLLIIINIELTLATLWLLNISQLRAELAFSWLIIAFTLFHWLHYIFSLLFTIRQLMTAEMMKPLPLIFIYFIIDD